jgi:hypothetical protein
MNTFVEIKASNSSLTKRSLVCRVGINDSWYRTHSVINNVRVVCPYYSIWSAMIKRCYESKVENKNPSYIGCTVCDSWHTFSNFRSWMILQDYTNKQLDKDILVFGNKIYSPDTCLFVSQKINTLIKNSSVKKGSHPVGISWYSRDKCYRAYCHNGVKLVHLGYFDTEDEAVRVYKDFKSNVILEVANNEEDLVVRQALLRIAELFKY